MNAQSNGNVIQMLHVSGFLRNLGVIVEDSIVGDICRVAARIATRRLASETETDGESACNRRDGASGVASLDNMSVEGSRNSTQDSDVEEQPPVTVACGRN